MTRGQRLDFSRLLDIALQTLACGGLVAACILVSAKKYFWCDEIFTWTLVTDRSVWHMLGALVQGADGAPPLFYVIARLWTRVFGTGELAFRSISCAGFVVALVVMWTLLRRVYGWWPAAVASLTAFTTSQLVLYQVAEARFYGLLTGLVACAVYLSAQALASRPPLSARLLTATALVHGALLYTHLFGALYSGAILAGWIVADRVKKRPWHPGYLSVVAGWICFVPWLPALPHLAAVAKPRYWLVTPRWQDLVTIYGFTLRAFPLVIGAVVLIAGVLPLVLCPHRLVSGPSPVRVRWGTLARVGAGVAILGAGLCWLPTGVPTAAALRAAWTSANSASVLALLLVVAVQHVASRSRRAVSGEMHAGVAALDEPLLIIGAAMLAVPAVAFVMSYVGTPIFLDRYFIPATLGLMPFIAHFARWTASTPGRDEDPGSDRAATAIRELVSAPLLAMVAILPAWSNRALVAQPRPGTEVEALAPAGAEVVVESALDLLPVRHYQRRSDLTYVYPFDRAEVFNPHSYAGAAVEYNLLDIWRRVGYLGPVASSGTQVPCEGRPFVVLHSWRLSWYDDRIAHDPAFAIQWLGQSWSTLEKGGILLVRRRRGSVPPLMCVDPAHARPGG